MFEKVLRVERPNELRSVQALLRLYGKEHSVVLLSLGGAQYINAATQTHLEEVKRITPHVFALIDSEVDHDGAALDAKRADLVANCTSANVACRVLKRRAIENYLSERAIQLVKGEKYRALGHYEKLGDAAMPWAKSENWRIARAMEAGGAQGDRPSKFLDEL